MTLRQLSDAVPQTVKTATAVVAVFSAGAAFNASSARFSGLPTEVGALRDELTGLRADINSLRDDLALAATNARRVRDLEDALCAPDVIAVLGPDLDRRCYAILRGRPAPTAP